MPWFFTLRGNASGNSAEVNASNELKVALSPLAATAGFAKMLDGTGEALHVTDTGALLTSGREVVLYEQVDGANLNTNKWITSVSGMTVAQSGGYINLNSGAALTASAYAILQSIKSIPLYGSLPVLVSANIKSTVLPQANATLEFGIGTVSGNSAPTDGCYFRWNPNGNFQCIINNGSGETIADSVTPPAINDSALLEIEVVENAVAFFINDVEVASVTVPVANAFPTNAGRLPVFLRVYNGGSSPATAPVLSLGQLTVVQQDFQQRRDWGAVLASNGQAAYQSPISAFAQTANHANSTSPSSATLSNTAAGYTTLGGRWQFAAVAGAATDYALFAFQVPAGYQLYVKSIAIAAANLGAIAAVTGTVLDWALGINASAVSLATADGAGTWAPRRIPLGMQSFAVGAAIGALAADIVRSFDTPLVVDGGRYLHVILAVPLGTATISEIIRGDVAINGYFE